MTRTAAARVIAVCADDFGLDPQVNAAALMLARLGRLSAVACMVGAPFWRADARALRALDPEAVQAGLHLDLTQHPLDAHVQRSLPAWLVRSHAGIFDARALRREIDAQLDAFMGEMHRPPAFVDGHEHVHQLPGVRDVLVDALAARGLRPWLRATQCPPGLRSRKARIVAALGAAALRRRAQANGLRQNRRLLGVYGFDEDEHGYLQRLREWLALAQDGDLLVCHPANAFSPVPHAAARCGEFAALAGAAFGALLLELRVHIAPLPAC